MTPPFRRRDKSRWNRCNLGSIRVTSGTRSAPGFAMPGDSAARGVLSHIAIFKIGILRARFWEGTERGFFSRIASVGSSERLELR